MNFPLKRGVNFWGWGKGPSKWEYGYDPDRFFSADDIQRCADLGCDHIRFPITESIMWDETGSRIPAAWDVMNEFITWCLDRDLRVIADLHTLRSHHFNNPERPLFTDPGEPERFAGLWRDLSAGLKDWPPDKVAYELMNEAVAEDAADWNRVYKAPYRALRELEPDRVIVLGSNRWNQAQTFDELEIPESDSNLLLTFHYYNPMQITHYKASFVAGCAAYDGPIQYPGQPISDADIMTVPEDVRPEAIEHNRYGDASVMEADLAQPLAARERTGYPVFCGEFGVISNTPRDIAARWARDFRTVLEAHNIPWTVWCYRGGFGIYDNDGNPTGVHEGLFTD